jgi:hypothetical protein
MSCFMRCSAEWKQWCSEDGSTNPENKEVKQKIRQRVLPYEFRRKMRRTYITEAFGEKTWKNILENVA